MSRPTTPRRITVKTPLPANELLFYKASIVEQLGQPFDIVLDLLSPNDALDLEALLGQEICIDVGLPSGDSRYFHAYIAHASQLGRHGDKAAYRVRAVPWLWFLTRTTDCRIYQNRSAVQIVQEIFREHHKFTDFRESFASKYRTRDYCVQYRESDFDFVQRLLQEEGIYYFFEHTGSTHTLVFADGSGAHESAKDYATIPYHSPDGAQLSEREHIYEWQLSREVQSGKQVLTDYDFTKPSAVLKTQHVIKRKSAKSDFELFDYPGGYTKTKDEGDDYVRSRLEAVQARFERVHGKGSVRGIGAGNLFSLENHPRQDQNKKYLVVGASHTINGGDYESGLGDAEPSYTCSFEAMDAKEAFRSLPTTPKPRVGGPQTATVVGPKSKEGEEREEIWTDKYGRVKVQFHWDRLGDHNENSSCWVRVAQVWAGQNFGWMSIPRVDQEVVVDFLEGDPDRPLITGRVYNQDNMPPYELPENKTQSGVKTRSSKGGTLANFNEIRFEDKKGAEQLYIHAEKNQDVVVENDASVSIGNDRKETIEHDERIEIGNDRIHSVGGKLSLSIDKSESHIVKDARTTSVAKDDELSVGKNLKITAADSVTIVAGGASFALKKDGSIVIKGKEITFDGTKINLKASGDITLKGSKVKQN